MSTTKLLADLARLGIRLEADGDRLRYAPRSAMTPAIIEQLRAHKCELLAALTEPDGPCTGCRSAVMVRLRDGRIQCPACDRPGQDDVAGKVVLVHEADGSVRWANFQEELESLRCDQDGVPAPSVWDDSFPPHDPCLKCGGIDFWWNVAGKAHCEACNPSTRSMELLELAERIRQKCGTSWLDGNETFRPLVGGSFPPTLSPRPPVPLPTKCPSCKSITYVDVAIHGGKSARRDCAQCGRTWGFARWNDGSAQGDAPRVSQESADGMEST